MAKDITIQHLYSDTSGNKPTSLEAGEIAINRADKKIYISDSNDNIVAIGGDSTSAPNLDNVVTTDTNQEIDGEKTFNKKVTIKDDESYDPSITVNNTKTYPRIRAYYGGSNAYVDLTFNTRSVNPQLHFSAYYNDGSPIYENKQILTTDDLSNVVKLHTDQTQTISSKKIFTNEVAIASTSNINPKLTAYYEFTTDNEAYRYKTTLDLYPSNSQNLELWCYYPDGRQIKRELLIDTGLPNVTIGAPLKFETYNGEVFRSFYMGAETSVSALQGNMTIGYNGQNRQVALYPTRNYFASVLKNVNIIETPMSGNDWSGKLYYFSQYGYFGYGNVSLGVNYNFDTLCFTFEGVTNLANYAETNSLTEELLKYGTFDDEGHLIPYGGEYASIYTDRVGHDYVQGAYPYNSNEKLFPLYEVHDGDYILDNGCFVSPEYIKSNNPTPTGSKVIGCVIDAKRHLFVANDPNSFIYGRTLCPTNNGNNNYLTSLGLDLANSCGYDQSNKIIYNQIEKFMSEYYMNTYFPCFYTHYLNNKSYKFCGKTYFPTVNEIFKIGKQISHINNMYSTPHIAAPNSSIKAILEEQAKGPYLYNTDTLGTITPTMPVIDNRSVPLTRENFSNQIAESGNRMGFYGFYSFLGDSYIYSKSFSGDKSDVLYIMVSVYD